MFDLAIILITGTLFGLIATKIKLPAIIGMIIAGMIIGTYGFNLISDNFLSFSGDIKTVALIILMVRAGLALDINEIKDKKRLLLSLSFLPALIEILIITVIAPLLLPITYLEAAMLGSIICAVSPAVVVDRALKLFNKGYGKKHNIPELLLVGGSLDSIFAVLVFNSILNIYQSNYNIIQSFINIPIELLTGLIFGVLISYIINILIKKYSPTKMTTILLYVGLCFLIASVEKSVNSFFPFSSLIAIITITILLKKNSPQTASLLILPFYNFWKIAEVLLFVLVGCSINVSTLSGVILPALIIITIALIAKLSGVWLSLLKSDLTNKEKLFCMLAYIPKATVQASIGGIPLSLGYNFGTAFLAISILAIVITTPLGTIAIDKSYKKLLEK